MITLIIILVLISIYMNYKLYKISPELNPCDFSIIGFLIWVFSTAGLTVIILFFITYLSVKYLP